MLFMPQVRCKAQRSYQWAIGPAAASCPVIDGKDTRSTAAVEPSGID